MGKDSGEESGLGKARGSIRKGHVDLERAFFFCPAVVPGADLPASRYFVMAADLSMGQGHLIAHPDAVAFQFAIVLARTDGGTPRATFITIQ